MSQRFKRFNMLVGTSLVLGLAAACGPKEETMSGQVIEGSGQVTIGGPFTLVDHHGKTVTETNFVGKAQLIYFGYSYCPDVCPTALQKMGAALSLAGADTAAYYQPIFISVDTQRDTPAQMALYVTANGFPKGMVGLSGSPAQMSTAIEAFGVVAQRRENPEYPEDFTYDHTDLIYLMDEQGQYVAFFTSADSPATIAERLIAYKKTGR